MASLSDKRISRIMLVIAYVLLVGSVAFLSWYIEQETQQIDEEICAQLGLQVFLASEFDESLFPNDPGSQALYRQRVTEEYNRVCAR
jgi:hypothetical protein